VCTVLNNVISHDFKSPLIHLSTANHTIFTVILRLSYRYCIVTCYDRDFIFVDVLHIQFSVYSVTSV